MAKRTITRTKEENDIIVSNMSDPYVIEEFITQEEIQYLIDLYENTGDKIYKNTGPVTKDISKLLVQDPVMKAIFDRIKEKIGECGIFTSMYFNVQTPHIIHNDDDFLSPITYKAITLPLRIEYQEENTGYPKLCFFDQFYLKGPSKFFNGAQVKVEQFYNEPVYSYEDVQNLSTAEIPAEIYHNYLTHIKPNWLKGLSFKQAETWKPGNAIIFDAVRLHCASDFVAQKIKSKLGISIFTALPRAS
jgi:hypothetical protein